MKISNDIRNWCAAHENALIDVDDCDELRDLAYRIDIEMVELPRDADGAHIHVGDTVFVKSGNGEEEAVSSITLTGGTAAVTTACRRIKAGFRPAELAHESHDSLERIADELDEMVNAASHADDTCERLAALAERIRKLAEKEDK